MKDLTKEQLRELENIEVGKFFISGEEVEKLRKIVEIDENANIEELQRARYQAVHYLSERFDEVYLDDTELGMRLLNNMSAIASVFDQDIRRKMNEE